MQGYVTVIGTPDPFQVLAPGSTAMSIRLSSPLQLNWTTGHTDLIPVGYCVNQSAGTTVDATVKLWLVVARLGQTTLLLVAESDYANLDTITGSATWAVIAWITSSRIDEWQQV